MGILIVPGIIAKSQGELDGSKDKRIGIEHLVIFEEGEEVRIITKNEKVRILLISGKRIGKPVVWYGPIVMNTQEELRIAFEEFENGTFIKH